MKHKKLDKWFAFTLYYKKIYHEIISWDLYISYTHVDVVRKKSYEIVSQDNFPFIPPFLLTCLCGKVFASHSAHQHNTESKSYYYKIFFKSWQKYKKDH